MVSKCHKHSWDHCTCKTGNPFLAHFDPIWHLGPGLRPGLEIFWVPGPPKSKNRRPHPREAEPLRPVNRRKSGHKICNEWARGGRAAHPRGPTGKRRKRFQHLRVCDAHVGLRRCTWGAWQTKTETEGGKRPCGASKQQKVGTGEGLGPPGSSIGPATPKYLQSVGDQSGGHHRTLVCCRFGPVSAPQNPQPSGPIL